MQSITGTDVNEAYFEALWRMKISGVDQDTRNGKVKRIPGPVCTTYMKPTRRLLLDPNRDANPFFHIFEGIWMLAGRDDVKWIGRFNSNIPMFSDNGTNFHGAYGYRWRHAWEHDQILWLIAHLKEFPNSRRGVIQMFHPDHDQVEHFVDQPLDIPCNTTMFFEVYEGSLNLTVCNRSNDIIWGCYGANAVHMSMLQELVANALGVQVGAYVQFSNNFHVYERHFPLVYQTLGESHGYTAEMIANHVSLSQQKYWFSDLGQLAEWIDDPNGVYDVPYIATVLSPMLKSWDYYKNKDKESALDALTDVQDVAVRYACSEWLKRRKWS